ncbi:MAG: hypothetical protein U5N85_15830 [Arcicella sp.]|nr:hypothetical protein [Arcicella sp.]
MENETIITFSYASKANYQCVIDIDEHDQVVIMYTILGTLVTSNRLNKIAQLLTKINFGLRIGNFEMDYDDGQIRCKTSIDYEGIKDFDDSFIENLILINLTTTDKFYQAIEEGLHTRKTIEKILEKF